MSKSRFIEFLDTKVNPNSLLFSQRERESPKSSCEEGDRVVRWCWVNFQCRGVPLIWIIVRQGPTVLAVGAGWGCLDIFSLVYSCYQVYSKVSYKNACRSIDSDLTYSTILDSISRRFVVV